MKRILLALAVLLAPFSVHAQSTVQTTVKTVTTCGSGVTYTAGKMNYPTVDTTGVTCTNSSGGGGGGGAVYGPTANGAPAANPPVVVGGTADGSATGNVGNLKVDSAGLAYVSVNNAFNLETTQQSVKTDLDALAAAIGGAIPAGSNLIGHVDGAAASGASVSGNPLLEGCRAATAAPTAVTDGQAIAAQCGAEGARVIRPYAIKELMVRGSTGAVTNTTQTSIIASAGGSLKNYITAIQCANSGASTSILTFTDAAATVLINPAGGGGSWTFPIPLVTAAATAFQVTPGTSSTSQYCSAQGYTGL